MGVRCSFIYYQISIEKKNEFDIMLLVRFISV